MDKANRFRRSGAVTSPGLILTMLAMAGPALASAPAAVTPTMVSAPAPISAFVPEGFNVPVLVETANFKLVPLGPNLAKVDFDAYMSSIEHLQKTFSRSTSWPREGISADEAMRDMEQEQARFRNRESFAYAVLSPDGTRERGCVYVYPSTVPGYDAIVRMWVTKGELDAGFDAELYAWVTAWIQTAWPMKNVAYPGRAVAWDKWDAMIAANTVSAGLAKKPKS